MAQFLPFEILDTKWYSYEHQGNIGKTRLLWSDSLMVLEGKDSVMCDHYRLDIKIIDSTSAIRESEDYFMTNLLNDSDYVTFTRRWVKDTVDNMDVEELKRFTVNALHEDMEEILQYQSQRAVFDEMCAWDEDTFEEVAKDYPIVLEDTDGWTEEDFADYRKETFIDINNTGGKY